MNIHQLLKIEKLQEPLYCVHGNIFKTPAQHIAFAVHYPNKKGDYSNVDGFAGQVMEKHWPELGSIKFTKGEPISRYANGKYFHALPVQTNEERGWDDAPELIETCLNKLPLNSIEVVACVLIGGGDSGLKWGANIKNIGGMLASVKTVVLYVYEAEIFQLLVGTGVVAACLHPGKVKQFRLLNGETEEEIRKQLVA